MSTVFWDFDGTLAHSVSLWPRCGYEALKETDPACIVDFDEFRNLLLCSGKGFQWNCPDEDHTGHTGGNFWKYMNSWYAECFKHFGVPEDTARAAAEKVRGKLVRAENYALYDDVIKALSEVRAMGHTNALLSNNYPELPRVMAGLGIAEYFAGYVISGIEGYDKPRRELFEIAKSRFPSDRYYMVGDNPVADMLGGKNAGMTAILVHSGFSENADHCFEDLYSVVELLKSDNCVNE